MADKPEIDLLDTFQKKRGRLSNAQGIQGKRRSTIKNQIGIAPNLGQRKEFKNKIYSELKIE